MTSFKYKQTLKLLELLTEELKQQSLWQTSAPPTEALSSTQPFCYDTLTFAQWLQFIFITRMKMIIENHEKLPDQMSICPMAEDSFKGLGRNAFKLINILADIDELLTGKRQQTLHLIPSSKSNDD